MSVPSSSTVYTFVAADYFVIFGYLLLFGILIISLLVFYVARFFWH